MIIKIISLVLAVCYAQTDGAFGQSDALRSLRSLAEGGFSDAYAREVISGNNVTVEQESESRRSLEARLQCPNSNWYDCYGVTCCPYGLWCVETGCCRPGQKNCGSRACYEESTHYCCEDDYAGACKFGEDCVEGNYCCPSGDRRCGQKCYPPDKAQCCQRGDQAWPCWLSQLCGTQAGSCEECPIPTRTLMRTTTSTSTSTITSTVTEVAEEGSNYPDFTCLPVTVTNVDGAVLELGGDCNFSFQPPSVPGPDSTSTAASDADETAPPIAALRQRQNCNPTRTATTTVTTTVPVTTRSTTTTTVTVAPAEEGFSCPEMVVTNTLGDELSLSDDCSLELTLGDGENESEGAGNGDDVNSSGSGSSGEGGSDTGNESNNGTADGGSSAAGNSDNLHWWLCLLLLLAPMMQLR